MEKIRSSFGQKLRQKRQEKRLTQEDLANRSGLHSTYIGQIERGLRNPSLINIFKLAKALKVKSSDLLPF
jgi:transcriptional regulator with XRE-family HTH domain